LILGCDGADERSEDRPADVGWDGGTGRFAKESGDVREVDADSPRSFVFIMWFEGAGGDIDDFVVSSSIGPLASEASEPASRPDASFEARCLD